MPQRSTTKKAHSTQIQGSGSFVVFKKFTVKEMRDLRKQAKELSDEDEESDMILTDALFVDHIVDWNWVDEDGNKLPLPKENPDVINSLTDEEISFLTHNLLGVDEARKKT